MTLSLRLKTDLGRNLVILLKMRKMMKTYIANYIERMKPSFIINLIDRDDGNKKKQGLEKIPRESCI